MRGYRVEADVGEEDHGRSGQRPERLAALVRLAEQGVAEEAHPGVAVRGEGVPVGRVDVESAHADHEEHDRHLDGNHRGIEPCALLDPDDQDPRDEHGDRDPRQVEHAAGAEEVARRRIVVERRVGERLRQVDSEDRQDVLEVLRPAVGDGHRRHGILQDQVPPDDPGEQLAQRGVGICIGRARHGNHRREFRIAERREDAGDARRHKRHYQRGTGAVVGGLTGENEDAGADHGAHPEGGELIGPQDAPQAVLALHLLEEEAQGLGCEEGIGQAHLRCGRAPAWDCPKHKG